MSSFGTINWADLGKGVLVAFLTIFLGSLYTTLSQGAFPTGAEMTQWLAAGLAAAVGYIIKNIFTNSNNELAKTEPK